MATTPKNRSKQAKPPGDVKSFVAAAECLKASCAPRAFADRGSSRCTAATPWVSWRPIVRFPTTLRRSTYGCCSDAGSSAASGTAAAFITRLPSRICSS